MYSWEVTQISCPMSTAIKHCVEKGSETEFNLTERKLLWISDAWSNSIEQNKGNGSTMLGFLMQLSVRVKTGSSVEEIYQGELVTEVLEKPEEEAGKVGQPSDLRPHESLQPTALKDSERGMYSH